MISQTVRCQPWAVPHPVKTRQSKVQMRMRTWLNMAELVLWMALWTSFYKQQNIHRQHIRTGSSQSGRTRGCSSELLSFWFPASFFTQHTTLAQQTSLLSIWLSYPSVIHHAWNFLMILNHLVSSSKSVLTTSCFLPTSLTLGNYITIKMTGNIPISPSDHTLVL